MAGKALEALRAARTSLQEMPLDALPASYARDVRQSLSTVDELLGIAEAALLEGLEQLLGNLRASAARADETTNDSLTSSSSKGPTPLRDVPAFLFPACPRCGACSTPEPLTAAEKLQPWANGIQGYRCSKCERPFFSEVQS